MKFIRFLFVIAAVCAYGSTEDLKTFLQERGVGVGEGHICTKQSSMPQFFIDLLRDNPQIERIAEIGFNAGHSSVLFLSERSDVEVTSFDIMRHGYVKVGKEFVDTNYPGRHRLIGGDSLKSVPEFHCNHPGETFDLIFIDGGHRYDIALNDIINMKALAHKNTLVVIDDLTKPGRMVHKAWRECIARGLITEGEFFRSNHKAWALCRYK